MKITTRLVGQSFRPASAQLRAKSMSDGDLVLLHPEPTNQYDPNAIKVIDDETGYHIGYVPRTDNEAILPLLADGLAYARWEKNGIVVSSEDIEDEDEEVAALMNGESDDDGGPYTD